MAALKGAEFPRLRIGIGSTTSLRMIDFVMTEFSSREMPLFVEAKKRAAEAAECWRTHGIDFAMNKFN